MSEYAIKIEDEQGTHGPYSEAEICQALTHYREAHPDDDKFSRVSVWEMRPGGTAGTERSVWEFIHER